MSVGLIALLDDISMLADDVAVNSKVAVGKTAGILGDDLAVNAQQASTFEQSRELQVIWAITKGSFINKLILLPIVFLLTAYASFLIPYIFIFGGFYLLYEGAEKIGEFFEKEGKEVELLESTKENVLEVEKKKIKSAIFTDFILSIEIVMVALSTVIKEPLLIQIVVTSIAAFLATIGVYGIVALIVRIDNIGFWLVDKGRIKSGEFLISLMPKIISFLSIVGTFAMILVGGGLLCHNIESLHYFFIDSLPSILNSFLVGIIISFIILGIVKLYNRIFA